PGRLRKEYRPAILDHTRRSAGCRRSARSPDHRWSVAADAAVGLVPEYALASRHRCKGRKDDSVRPPDRPHTLEPPASHSLQSPAAISAPLSIAFLGFLSSVEWSDQLIGGRLQSSHSLRFWLPAL